MLALGIDHYSGSERNPESARAYFKGFQVVGHIGVQKLEVL